MTTAAIAIRDLEEGERAWANGVYRDIQFATTPPDAIALVAEVDGARVGLGRLVTLARGVLELGGIWTDDAVRGRGVARAMVNALLARVGGGLGAVSAGGGATTAGASGRLWCIPFVHLSAFYQSFGFAACPPPWPPAVAAKVDTCVAQALPAVDVLVR